MGRTIGDADPQPYESPLDYVPRIRVDYNVRAPWLIASTGKVLADVATWTGQQYDQEQDGYGTFIMLVNMDHAREYRWEHSPDSATWFRLRGRRPSRISSVQFDWLCAKSALKWVRPVVENDNGAQNWLTVRAYVVRD